MAGELAVLRSRRPGTPSSRRLAATLALLSALIPACREPAEPEVGDFTVVARFTRSRYDPAVAALADGRVLIAGGASPDGAIIPGAEVFDPSDGSLGATPCDLVTPRRRAVAVTLRDGRVLIVGGDTGNLYMLLETEVFDPTGGCFARGPVLLERRGDVENALLLDDGRVLVIEGTPLYPDSVSGGAELIDADLGLVRVLDRDLGEETDRTSVAKLEDGRVLLVGGNIVGDDRIIRLTDRVVLFDPGTATFRLLPTRLSRPKSFMAVLPSPDGGALILGGGDMVATREIERFDPDREDIGIIGHLSQPRTLASAVLVDRWVLVVGGKGRVGASPLTTTEWVSLDGSSGGPGPAIREGVAIGQHTFVEGRAVVVVRPGGDPAGDSTTSIQIGRFQERQ